MNRGIYLIPLFVAVCLAILFAISGEGADGAVDNSSSVGKNQDGLQAVALPNRRESDASLESDSSVDLRSRIAHSELATLQGVVVYEDGNLLTGVAGDVTFRQANASVTSRLELDGSWAADLLSGEWRVDVTLADCSTSFSVTPAVINVSPHQLPFELIIQGPTLLGRVEGMVTDCYGHGVPNVRVSIGGRSGRTDSTGRYGIGCLLDGTDYTVVVDVPIPMADTQGPWWQLNGEFQRVGPEPVVRATRRGARFDFELSAGVNVDGMAEDVDGRPLAHSTLSIRSRGPGGETLLAGLNLVIQTDQNGRFETPPLLPGQWAARLYGASQPGVAVPDDVAFSVGCGESPQDVLLAFDDGLGGCEVRGWVVDLDGNAVEGLCLAIWRDTPELTLENRTLFQPKAFSYVDNAGEFAMSGLPPGRFFISRVASQQGDPGLVYWDSEERVDVVLDSCPSVSNVIWSVASAPKANLSILPELPSAQQGSFRLVVARSLDHRPDVWSRIVSLNGTAGEIELTGLPSGEVEVHLERLGADGEWLGVDHQTVLLDPTGSNRLRCSELRLWSD